MCTVFCMQPTLDALVMFMLARVITAHNYVLATCNCRLTVLGSILITNILSGAYYFNSFGSIL